MSREQAPKRPESLLPESEPAGKLANDHNKPGQPPASQRNQGRRTPASRDDRQAQMGSHNQSWSRKGLGLPGRGKTR